MSEVAESMRQEIMESPWMSENLKSTQLPKSVDDVTGLSPVENGEKERNFSEERENLKRLAGSMDGLCQNVLESGCCNASSGGDMKDACKNCICKCTDATASSAKRRCSTSDINFQASDFLLKAGFPMKKNSIGGLPSAGKSVEKIDKINLANLVFNPNFKNSAGCVNLPVIRAGQNLAQKNAQRAAMAKEAFKDPELNQLTQQAAIDLIAQQLQPPSLAKLNVKLQNLVQHRQLGSDEDPMTQDVGETVTTFSGKATGPSQSNALRYKTELCRSYEEGGECRFGSACTFAHGPEELRPVPRHPLYKTELCRTYHQHGYCQYGTRCHFIHDPEEADKNAPLRGCKSWGRHDQLSGALLSLASSSGIIDNKMPIAPQAASDNDVLLANLRRLYALRNMTQDKSVQPEMSQFSMTQPMAQQLSMAHSQLNAGAHLPLSMTQPLPMEALHMGMQRAGQMGQHLSGHVAPNNRVETLANDYTNWGITPPPSPTFSGVSPFGTYQQFSPLPHHQMGPVGPQSYPHYPFSATAPDLSTALNISPYNVSNQQQQQPFSNTVNVGHMLQDQNGNFPSNSLSKTASSSSATLQNPIWPPTSAEVSSVIDKELFGFGLDSQNPQGAYHHPQGGAANYHHPYYPQGQQSNIPHHMKQAQPSYPSSNDPKSSQASQSQKLRPSEHDLMTLLNNDKYIRDTKASLRPIMESSDEQTVRSKSSGRKD